MILIVDDMETRHQRIQRACADAGFPGPFKFRYSVARTSERDIADASIVFLDHDMCERIGDAPCPNPTTHGDNILDKYCGCKTGFDLACTMAEGRARPKVVVVHTQNPIGAARMVATLREAGFFVAMVPAPMLTSAIVRQVLEATS